MSISLFQNSTRTSMCHSVGKPVPEAGIRAYLIKAEAGAGERNL